MSEDDAVPGLDAPDARVPSAQAADQSSAGSATSSPARVRAALMSTLNHDLRAPLARIAAQAATARDLPQALQAIAIGVRHQLEWLADVQACLRYECHAPEPAVAPAHVYALWQQVENEGAALAREYGGDPLFTVDATLPPVMLLDRRLLVQVLHRLITHALQQGGPARLPCTLQCAGAGIALTLRFRVGDMSDAAYGEWRTVEPALGDTRPCPGLTLAAQLVTAMGGCLQQNGNRWRFELDVVAVPEQEAMPPAAHFELPEPFGAGHTVLLVEPQEAMRDYLTEVLESADFEVVYDAEEKPSLVLCADNVAGGVDKGWQLLHRLHTQYGADAPPVLLHALRPSRRPGTYPNTLAFAQVLYKPASPAMLLEAMRRLTPAGPR